MFSVILLDLDSKRKTNNYVHCFSSKSICRYYKRNQQLCLVFTGAATGFQPGGGQDF